MGKLSIVVPIFNEQETIPIFFEAIKKIRPKINYEIEVIFIDDGSKDDSLAEIKKLHDPFIEVHFVSFSRNFGKEAGMYAGLQKAQGDRVVIMDVDLQDPPELLPDMVNQLDNGDYDMIATRRINRTGEKRLRSYFANQFYRWINRTTKLNLAVGARDYRIMTRQVVDNVLKMQERQRFSKGLLNWVGFNTKYIAYENVERVAGTTSWSFWELVKYAIEGIISFSTAPLTFVTLVGAFSAILAVIGAIVVIVRALVLPGTSAFGWPSLVVIILFFSGVQLLALGIVGRYIAELYMEAKHRPLYVIKEEK